MSDEKTIQQQAEEAAAKAKEVGEQGLEKLKDSAVGKEILGDDGKFDATDVDRIKGDVEKVVESVKGNEEVEKVAKEAEGVFEGLADKAKDLFNK